MYSLCTKSSSIVDCYIFTILIAYNTHIISHIELSIMTQNHENLEKVFYEQSNVWICGFKFDDDFLQRK